MMAGGDSAAGAGEGLVFLFRSLKSRNYRLFFAGQLVSLIGTWLTNFATSWLVFRLSGDPRVLGWVGFAGQAPAFLLTPFAGVLVDRWRLHRVLVWTQCISMLQSFALAVVAFRAAPHGLVIDINSATARTGVHWLIGLAVVQGLVNAFDIPARQSFVVQLVEKREDLPNAIALNSSMFNFSRLLGPAVAGVLTAAFGEALCFTLDGISYIAVIVALLMMQMAAVGKPAVRRNVLAELKEGLIYAFGFKPMRAIILLLAAVSLLGTPYAVLMPVFTTQILKGGPQTQGILMASTAVGALVAAIRLANRRSVLGLGRVMPTATMGMGVGLVVFGFSHNMALSMVTLAVIGFCMMTQMASGNTLLQTLVEDRMRGRVMSLFTMAFMGMMPLGSLLAGHLAKAPGFGVQRTVAAGGVGCVIAAAVFASQLRGIREAARPIYLAKGILPRPIDAALGVEAAEGVLEDRGR